MYMRLNPIANCLPAKATALYNARQAAYGWRPPPFVPHKRHTLSGGTPSYLTRALAVSESLSVNVKSDK